MVKKIEDMYNRLYRIPACDGRIDRQTDRHRVPAYTALMHSIAR